MIKRPTYEEDFKIKMVEMYNDGTYLYNKISEMYVMSTSTIRGWVVKYNNTKSFNAKIIEQKKKKSLLQQKKNKTT